MRKPSVWLGVVCALLISATMRGQQQPPAREQSRPTSPTGGQNIGERSQQEQPFGSRILPPLGYDSIPAPRPQTRDYGGINRLAPLTPPAFQPETLALTRLPQPILRQNAPAAPPPPPVRLPPAISLNLPSGTLPEQVTPSAVPNPVAPARPGSPSAASPFQPLGSSTGMPLGSYAGAPLNAYLSAPLGAFIGAPTGASIGLPLNAYLGAPLNATPAAPFNGYLGPPLNAAPGGPLFAYIGPPQGSPPAVFGDPLLSLAAAEALVLRLSVMDMTLLNLPTQPLTPNALAPLAFAAPPAAGSGQTSDASRSADQPPFSRVIAPKAPAGTPPATRTEAPPARSGSMALPIVP
jgi:hypothetical protein